MSERIRLHFTIDTTTTTRDTEIDYFNRYLRRHTEMGEESTDIVMNTLDIEIIISTYPVYAALIISSLSERDGVKFLKQENEKK